MRIVLDTNLLVSALISKIGAPADLLDRWNDDQYDLVTSAEQIAELTRVLHYPRVAKYLDAGAADKLVERLSRAAIVAVDLPSIDRSPDPDDNLILATAVAGQASLLISGDTKHVLPLGDIEGIPIITIAEALKWLQRPPSS